MEWKIADAEHRLNQIAKLAKEEGPQTIEDVGGNVVLISEETFRRLTEREPTFKEWLLSMPSTEGMDFSRDKSPMRDIEL